MAPETYVLHTKSVLSVSPFRFFVSHWSHLFFVLLFWPQQDFWPQRLKMATKHSHKNTACRHSLLPNNAPCLPVYSHLHARAGAGGGLPLPDWLRTLLLLLAQERLRPLPGLSGERVCCSATAATSRPRPQTLSSSPSPLLFLCRSSSASTSWCWCCVWSWTDPTSSTTLCHWSPSGLWSSTLRWPPGRKFCRSTPTVVFLLKKLLLRQRKPNICCSADLLFCPF